MMLSRRPLFVVTGTTGSGKNGLGIELAARLGGEVISLDSMKVYRGMDVGTAKPSPAELERVRHHLIDVYEPSERVDLARFLERADQVVTELHARAVPVIAVGGTAMYLTGLLYGVHEGPPRDDDFRRALREERDRIGTAALHERLAAIDPERAARVAPADFQRIERALEIHALSGRRPSELEANWFAAPRYQARVVILTWPRDVLRRRIEDRVERMFAAGFVDEVRRIEAAGGFSIEAAQAIGYREILDFLRRGGREAALRERIKLKTWQFARRQLTWMTKYPDAERIVCAAGDTAAAIADRLAPEFRRLWESAGA